MVGSYTGTETFARFSLLELQVAVLLREAGGALADSIKSVKKGLADPHYIHEVAVRGLFSDGDMGAELRLVIDWRTHTVAVKAGGSHMQVPGTWNDGVAPSLSEAMSTFLAACQNAGLETEWVVCYGPQHDRDEVNRLLGFRRARVRAWRREPDRLHLGFGQLSEASLVVSLAT